jgi:hypothetical protein
VEVNDEGHRRLQFSGTPDIRRELDRLGEVPLPPYIARHPAKWAKTRSVIKLFCPDRRFGRGADRRFAFHAGNCWMKFARAA